MHRSALTLALLSLPASAQVGFDRTDYPLLVDPHWVAVDDVNADGAVDLVVADRAGKLLVTLPGIGDGTFGAPIVSAVPASPWSVALGDVNGDGTIDAVTSDHELGRVTTHLGAGDGSFTPFGTELAGNDPRTVALAHLDGDGLLDLAVGSAGSADVVVRFGAGDGTFPSANTFTADAEILHVDLVDLEGDGDIDIVGAQGGYEWRPFLVLNQGDGTFVSQMGSYGNGDILWLAAGDYNADGFADLAMCVDDGVEVFVDGHQNSGSNTFPFTDWLDYVGTDVVNDLADFDGNGFLDSVTTSHHTLTVNLNTPFGFVSNYVEATIDRAEHFAVADLDGNGTNDVVTVSVENGPVANVLLNTFCPAPEITSVAPTQAPSVAVGLNVVALAGCGFAETDRVIVDGIVLPSSAYQVVDDTTLLFDLPLVSQLGPTTVEVTSPGGAASAFVEVVAPSPPVIELDDALPALIAPLDGATLTLGGAPRGRVPPRALSVADAERPARHRRARHRRRIRLALRPAHPAHRSRCLGAGDLSARRSARRSAAPLPGRRPRGGRAGAAADRDQRAVGRDRPLSRAPEAEHGTKSLWLRRAALAAGGVALAELVARVVLALLGDGYSAAELRAELTRAVDGERELPTLDTGAPDDVAHEADGRIFLHPYYAYDTNDGAERTAWQLALAREGADAALGNPYLILVVGGSVAELFGTPGRGGTERLTELLAADERLGGRPVYFLSNGRPAFKQPQQTMLVADLLGSGLEPDLVLNLDGFNEVALASLNRRWDAHPGHPSFFHWSYLSRRGGVEAETLDLALDVRAAGERAAATAERALRWHLDASCVTGLFVRWRVRAALADRVAAERALVAHLAAPGVRTVAHGPEFEGDAVEHAVESWVQGSLSIDALCQRRGIAYLHVLQPTLHDEGSKPLTAEERSDGAAEPEIVDGVRRGYPLLREAGERLRDAGVAFVDGSEAFRTVEQRLYEDLCHFDRAGAAILAELVAPSVAELLAR